MKNLALLGLVATLLPLLTNADSPPPLPPNQVYQLQVHAQGGAIMAHWDILPGYYLYRNRFQFISETAGITLGRPHFPAGEMHHDAFFGSQEIYRNGLTARIPYTGSGALTLAVVYQGCADIGFCYPPQTQHFSLPLADPASVSVHPPNLAALVAGGNGTQGFPPPDQVFHFTASAKDSSTVAVRWRIADGYYLYRQKFHFTSANPGVVLGVPDFPQGEIEHDQYFGTSEIYRHSVDALIPVTHGAGIAQFTLTATYQGCADKGLCYPPITKTVPIDFAAPGATTRPKAAPTPQRSAPVRVAPVSQQGRLAKFIRSGNLAWVLLVFLGLGLALTFTPCVLPMIPIIAGLIAGQQQTPSTARAFFLSLAYVLAMALTYTVAGIVVALIGANVQAWFQNPWIVSMFSLIFILLALSMFGLYELQMPSAVQTRLVGFSNAQKGGAFVGVAIMGVLSALIVGPCITAPLVAALLVISQSGDPVRGGLTLFALGIGMGIPLLIVGTTAGRFVPKAGAWMVAVKYVLGVVLLGVAIWFLSRILPGSLTLLLWAALAIVSGAYLAQLDARDMGWRKLWKAVGGLVGVYGIVMLVGAASGSTDPLQPLARLRLPDTSVQTVSPTVTSRGLHFTQVRSLADLNRAVARAARQHKTAMLDFYASWCVSCKEMTHGAFMNPEVKVALANTVLLQADVTANNAQDQALLKHFGIYGPPSIMFFNRDGQELSAYRVVGYMGSQAFARRIRQAFNGSTRQAN